MNINLRPININNKNEIEAYVKWENDLEFYHLIAPMKSEDSKVELITYDSTIRLFQQKPDKLLNTYIISDKDKPIGQITIQDDPPHLLKKEKKTCWIGLMIGEKNYWGKGAAQEAMNLLEEVATKRGFQRIELGVFEFNVRAQKFYKKLGYVRIGIIKDFTYWDSKFWDDIRMEKKL